MKKVHIQSKGQERWNQYGRNQIEAIEENPDKFIINDLPYGPYPMYHDLMKSLGCLQGMKVIEFGCGKGLFSVFLAKQGAETIGIDIGPDLVAASRHLAKINDVSCKFQQANITRLPFDVNSFHIVVGIAILHHLSEADVIKAIQETHRVVKEGGKAIFCESVENSKMFDFIQNLFPVGQKGSQYFRPSLLSRKSWVKYIERLDERAMTSRELISAGAQFKVVKIRPYGFLIRLQRLIGTRYSRYLIMIDAVLFKILPPLKHLCRNVIVEYHK